MASALDRVNNMIESLEKDLGLAPGAPLSVDQPPTSSKQENKKKKAKKKTKKEKKPAKPTPAAADQPEVTKLDIRVGLIKKAWKHDTADKLYCEEIDVGEDSPRQIASGLVPHYPLDQMQNRRVLVLCNLKARNLVGFKSHGMVMCAAKEKEGGGEKVVFVEPPADAKIGERIVFKDLEGEPFSPAQVEKKKVLQKIGTDMRTDDEGVAMYQDHVFLTSAGPCTAVEVPGGVIR